MTLSWILAVLWLVFLVASIARGRRYVARTLKPVEAPITESWGMYPRFGDQYSRPNVGGCLLTLFIAAVGMVVMFVVLNIDTIQAATGYNSFLVVGLGLLVVLAIAIGVGALRSWRNFQTLSRQVPPGNCLVNYQKPMALHESAIFTLTFGLEEGLRDAEEPVRDDNADRSQEVPAESGGWVAGVFYTLPPRARGMLRVEARAPAFTVKPRSREIRVPIREGAQQARFVVQANQIGKQAFIFDLSLKDQPVGGFEAIIPVRSLATERALRLAQFVAPITTIATIVLKVLGYID
jgi:hypothetical protein